VTGVSLSDDLFAADLLADGPPEAEFEPGVASRMPRKRVAAGAVIRDPGGRLLMVEPRYKPTWDIPGGIVEADETPLDACRREIREELGLDLPVDRLLVVDWVPRRGVWHDAVLFVFDGGTVTPDQLAAVTLPPDELAAVRLVCLDQATDHIRPSMQRRLRAALDVADAGASGIVPGPAYLHFGRRPATA
jgi:8-oxo-dGTP pyrophosphatase MutT (NUDIX family)